MLAYICICYTASDAREAATIMINYQAFGIIIIIMLIN